MRLRGITDNGFNRMAKYITAQSTEPDYGDGTTPHFVKMSLEKANAEWTPEGWVINGDLNMMTCNLTRLPLIKSIEGNLNININNLTFLDGSPKEVGGSFDCSSNQLTSLEGAPQTVGSSFNCSRNELTSLLGCPTVGFNFDCSSNQLTSLEGAPHEIRGTFNCKNNLTIFTEEDVRAVCDVGWVIAVGGKNEPSSINKPDHDTKTVVYELLSNKLDEQVNEQLIQYDLPDDATDEDIEITGNKILEFFTNIENNKDIFINDNYDRTAADIIISNIDVIVSMIDELLEEYGYEYGSPDEVYEPFITEFNRIKEILS
jgi:uncharacterized protein YbcI